MVNRKRYSAILMLAVALLAGCEGKPEQWRDPFPDVCSTSAWMGNGGLRVEKFPCEKSVDWSEVNRKLDNLTDYEFTPDQRQELIGRTVVMVARGWSEWPDSYTFEGHTQPLTIDMGMMKPNTQYRVTVQEIKP